jgi:hypothetical protein
MKPLRGGGQEYASGIDKALRRASLRAQLTAAATGTRLVIYEKGRIRRVRPPAKLNIVRMIRDMAKDLPRGSKDHSHMELKESPGVPKNLEVQRGERKHAVVAEKRAKYRSK